MAKKKKQSAKSVTKNPVKKETSSLLFGLTKEQTQSLSVGIVIVGLGLFILAGLAYKSNNQPTQSILATGAATAITPTNFVMETSVTPTQEIMPTAPVATPTATALQISPTPTTTVAQVSPAATATPKMVGMVKKLPNTSSKVTYTVMDGDNIASIGQKLCDSDRAWLSIVATNAIDFPYIVHSGETYTITCN